MKILVINNNAMFENEQGLYIFKNTGEFLLGLKETGAEVETFHFRMKMGENSFMATFNLLNKGLKITSVFRDKFKYINYIKAYIIGIKRLLKSDFLYIFYPNSFIFLSMVAVVFHKPYGIYVRGEQGIESRTSKFFFKHARIVLTVSPVFTEKMKSYKCKTDTIRPMINYSIDDIVKDRKYENKGVFKLLFLGRIENQKGITDLIMAIKLLKDSNVNSINLDIIGDGPDIVTIKKMVSDLNLKSIVTFHGSILDKVKIQDYYKKADIFVFPTHPNHEGFPRVLYEAMIFGTPIIGTSVGAISYLMKDKYNYYEVVPKNFESLANKILDVINNYENCAIIAKNAMKTVFDYLSEKKESHHIQLIRLIKTEIV